MYSQHQGAMAFRLDHETLEMTLMGQTASHSFCNSMVASKNGNKFIGYEVGDNFPRGLQTFSFGVNDAGGSWAITDKNVFYQFKAKHSTCEEAQGYINWGGDPNPQTWFGAAFDDGSAPGTCFSKQANDNAVYSEIAHSGIIETEDGGRLMVFAGESPAFLANGLQPANDPSSSRNLAVVKLDRDGNPVGGDPEEKG
jgi:hypothetical protein